MCVRVCVKEKECVCERERVCVCVCVCVYLLNHILGTNLYPKVR